MRLYNGCSGSTLFINAEYILVQHSFRLTVMEVHALRSRMYVHVVHFLISRQFPLACTFAGLHLVCFILICLLWFILLKNYFCLLCTLFCFCDYFIISISSSLSFLQNLIIFCLYFLNKSIILITNKNSDVYKDFP